MIRQRIKKAALIIASLTLIFILGCSGETTGGKIDSEEALYTDAKANLKGAIVEDYTRLTIIRGSLYKFSIDPAKNQYLGISIGALQATIFPKEYEYDRLTKLENISAETKKEIITQPLLNILVKNRDTLTRLHNEILDPLAKQLDQGRSVTAEQVAVLNQVVRLLDRMVAEYDTLCKEDINYNGKEAENAFFQMQNYQKELRKLKLPPALLN